MRLKYKYICSLLFILCLQTGTYHPVLANKPQTNNRQATLDKKEWEKSSKNIDYTENYKSEKLKERDINLPKGRRTFNGIQLVRILLAAAIIGVIAIVLFFVLKNFLNYIDEQAPKGDLANIVENLEDNIHDADFDLLLTNALSTKEFKLAVRILYLKTIKELAAQDIIKWKKNKTNGQYVREIASPRLSQAFSFLTFAYENTWFSSHQLDEKKYFMLQDHFSNFLNQLG